MSTTNILSCSACGQDHRDLAVWYNDTTHEALVICPETEKAVYIITDQSVIATPSIRDLHGGVAW
jgi:hypothetical protein